MIRDVVSVSPDATLIDAIKMMTDYNVRHLPVTEDYALVGIVSDRDIRLHIISLSDTGGASEPTYHRLQASVADVMTKEPIVTSPDTDFQQILDIFVEEKVGVIPVVTGKRELIGIVGYIDLLAFLRDKL